MKKNILILLSLIFVTNIALAQTLDWVKEYYVYGNDGKQITGLTKDSSGNLVMSGKAQGFGSATWGSNLYKLNFNGDVLFSDTVVGDQWNSLQLHDNSIYTMGTELTKRDMNGNILSEQNLIWVGSSYLHAKDAVILGDHLYAIIFGDLIKYDLLGNQIWNQSLGAGTASHKKLFVLDGHIYVLSSFYSSVILKYDTLGNQIWNKSPGGPATNIYSDNNSNYYVFGMDNIVKLDANGDVVWSKTVDSTYILNGFVYNDTVYACGGNIAGGVGGLDGRLGSLVRLSDQTGQIYSISKFNFFSGMCPDEQLTNVYADNNGIYLGGRYCLEGPKVFLAKLSYNNIATTTSSIPVTESDFTIYPNPNEGIFNVAFENSKSENLKLEVKNILGQVVYSKTFQTGTTSNFKIEIDLSNQPKGNYFLEIMDDSSSNGYSGKSKKRQVKKIILN